MATNDMVTCPYNKEHRMLRKNLQKHVLKCKEIYKNEVELLECPFNKLHLISELDFFQHTKTCEDRKIISHYQFSAAAKLDEGTKHEKIEAEDNWDSESVPDYNPEQYVRNLNIVRDPRGLFRAQRKAYIQHDKRRILGADSDKNSNNTKHRSPTPRLAPYYIPNRKH